MMDRGDDLVLVDAHLGFRQIMVMHGGDKEW